MGVNASKEGKKSTTPGLGLTDASSSDKDFNQGTLPRQVNSETQDAENGETSQIGAAQVTPEELLTTAEEVEKSSKNKNDGQVSDDSKSLIAKLGEQALISIDLRSEGTSKNRDGQTSSSEVSSKDEPDEANKKGKDSTDGWVKKIKQGTTEKNKKKVSDKTRAQPSTEIVALREEIDKQMSELIKKINETQSWRPNTTNVKLEEENPTAREREPGSSDLASLSGILQFTEGGLGALKNNNTISTTWDKSQLKEIKEEFQKAVKSFGEAEKGRQLCKMIQKNLLKGCKCVIKGTLGPNQPDGITKEKMVLENIDKLLKQLEVASNENEQYMNNAAGNSQSGKLQRTQAQVGEVVSIMRVNIDKVLERDRKLSELDGRANALQAGASQFEKSSRKLKRKNWWENNKKALTLTTLVLGCALGGLAAWFWYKYIETKDLPAAPSLVTMQKNLLITASVFTGVAFLAFGVFLSSICCPSSCITGGSANTGKVASCEVSSIH